MRRQDIGPILQEYEEKKALMSQPRQLLISSSELMNGTIVTPLLLLYLQLELVCTKNYRFVEYTPVKCFNKIVQSVVNARRQGDENPNSSVAAETMKLPANSSDGFQILDRRRHSIKKYTNDEKTYAAINNEVFKRLRFINDQLYEAELAKFEIEHKEKNIVGFLILQYAKLRMLEVYYNFFTKLCITGKYEEIEMDTDSLYLALANIKMCDCKRSEKRQEWEMLRSMDCNDSFTADAFSHFFPRTCCAKHRKQNKRELGLFKEEFRCTEYLYLCSKTYCCYDSVNSKFKFSSKGLNKRTIDDSGEGPMVKNGKVLDETENVTYISRGFRTKSHCVATYEHTKKGLSYFFHFYP